MTSRLPGATVKEKLLLNTRLDGECLRWTGAHTQTGYGQISIDGRPTGVHRVAYEMFVGPIPGGLQIDHLYRVRDCTSVSHLEPVTQAENVRRAVRSKTRRRREGEPSVACAHGHTWTEATIYITPSGSRQCRPCKQEAKKRMKRRRHVSD